MKRSALHERAAMTTDALAEVNGGRRFNLGREAGIAAAEEAATNHMNNTFYPDAANHPYGPGQMIMTAWNNASANVANWSESISNWWSSSPTASPESMGLSMPDASSMESPTNDSPWASSFITPEDRAPGGALGPMDGSGGMPDMGGGTWDGAEQMDFGGGGAEQMDFGGGTWDGAEQMDFGGGTSME